MSHELELSPKTHLKANKTATLVLPVFKNIKLNWWWISGIILIGAYRFTLLGQGALSFPDEFRYSSSADALNSLLKGDFSGFCHNISSISGRPGDTMVRLVLMAIQQILTSLFGINYQNPDSLLIPQAINLLVSLLILVCFYKIAQLLLPETPMVAPLATGIYALLGNTNLYIRHILPYDHAFLIFLATLYLVLKRQQQKFQPIALKTYIVAGASTAIAYTVYPGYYFLGVLIFCLLVGRGWGWVHFKSKLFGLGSFIVAGGSVLAFFEVLSQIGGTSYLFSSTKLAGNIKQGSFEESFTFLPKYLLEVEKIGGAILLLLTSIFILLNIVTSLKTKFHNYAEDDLWLVISVILVCFLIQASASAIFYIAVFYGRLLHIYYPFLVLATIALLSRIKGDLLRKLVYLVVFSLFPASFVSFAIDYAQLAYPRDVLYRQGYRIENFSPGNVINESTPFSPFASPPPRDNQSGTPYNSFNKGKLINFVYFYPIKTGDFRPYLPPSSLKLVFQNVHFLSFSAYSYEGFNKVERNLLKERNYNVKIYAPKS